MEICQLNTEQISIKAMSVCRNLIIKQGTRQKFQPNDGAR